jgi:hypothetical protein
LAAVRSAEEVVFPFGEAGEEWEREEERMEGSERSVEDVLNVCENHPESLVGRSPIRDVLVLEEVEE